MPNFSQITITGHLGRDPEIREVSGTTVCNFSVAVKTGYGDRAITTWYRVAAWGKLGERAQEHLRKGDAVTITGEHSLREWESDKGKGASCEIRADRWSFAGSKKEQPVAVASDNHPQPAQAGFEDDIPFN